MLICITMILEPNLTTIYHSLFHHILILYIAHFDYIIWIFCLTMYLRSWTHKPIYLHKLRILFNIDNFVSIGMPYLLKFSYVWLTKLGNIIKSSNGLIASSISLTNNWSISWGWAIQMIFLSHMVATCSHIHSVYYGNTITWMIKTPPP